MGQVTSLFVRKVAAQVDPEIDRDELLRSIGLDPEASVDPKLNVGADDYYRWLEGIAARDRRATSLPLRVGASMRCDEYGAFGLAWKSAPDLRGSYRRAERYARVLTSVSTYTVEPAGEGGAYMRLHRSGVRRLGLRLSNEATLASIVAISREASSQPFKPLRVEVKHPAPADLSAHREYFGCPVHFGADRDALLVSKQALDAPNKLGDGGLAHFFDGHLQGEVAELESGDQRGLSLADQLRSHVADVLSDGVPAVSDVAAHLGLSSRTLQRRLADEELSFQVLVDGVRHHLAMRLLQETDYALVEVAFMTGFSEQSTFSRAFKRWAGQTPRSYRLQAGA
ncbi:MAG: AraC family transcriptional regulator [Acidobacteriota bacterium]